MKDGSSRVERCKSVRAAAWNAGSSVSAGAVVVALVVDKRGGNSGQLERMKRPAMKAHVQ